MLAIGNCNLCLDESNAMNIEKSVNLPDDCTFSAIDWEILSAYWHPVAYSDEVRDAPVARKLLDEELVLYRTCNKVTAPKISASIGERRSASEK